jgi:thiol-disulfide isomerase/thioredoxin
MDDGREIPFFLSLPADCGAGPAAIVNGRERIPVPCRRIGNHLRIDFPVFGTLIEAEETDDGRFSGRFCRELPGERACTLAFHARPIAAPDPISRFGPIENALSNVSGEWRFEFQRRGLARGTFEQLPSGEVNGTIEVPSEFGDLRFLAGVAGRDGIFLSTFDGQHALLLEGVVDTRGDLSGNLIDGEDSDPFVARRAESVALPDPRERVTTKGAPSLPFLSDARYRGKPVIVEIFGTWCPNCNDLAPVLARIHRQNRDRGLEVLSLAFEAIEDSEYVERRFREYKAKHGIDWEIVLAGTLDDLAEGEPSWLSGVEGVPVLVFVGRDGGVRATYAGFSGPATGEAHLEAVSEIEKLATEILEEL